MNQSTVFTFFAALMFAAYASSPKLFQYFVNLHQFVRCKTVIVE